MRQPKHVAAPLERVVTTRPLLLNGRQYKRGELVDTSALTKAKVAQLLEMRRLEPAPAGAE